MGDRRGGGSFKEKKPRDRFTNSYFFSIPLIIGVKRQSIDTLWNISVQPAYHQSEMGRLKGLGVWVLELGGGNIYIQDPEITIN